MDSLENIAGVIYCKECPNCSFIECINQFYCERYRVEIEDIARDCCEVEYDD